jgi:protein gp37
MARPAPDFLSEHYSGDSPIGVRLNADGWPLRNVWLGTSVENAQTASRRIPVLRKVPAALHFLSYEPALGSLLTPGLGLSALCGTDWLIAGAETGPAARPADLDWFREVRDFCASLRIPFFLKQVDARRTRELDGRRHEQFPDRKVTG